MVYGAVEVKGALCFQDLEKIAIDILKIRELAAYRYYITYGSKQKDGGSEHELVVDQNEFNVPSPAPRTFVFAYSQRGWKNIDGLVKSLQQVLKKNPAHIHGLVVLDKGWYLNQEAYSSTGHEFFAYTDNALLRFINDMLHAISSMGMFQASIDRYLRLKLPLKKRD